MLPCLRVPHSGPLPFAAVSSQGEPLCSVCLQGLARWGAPTERHLGLGLPIGAQLCGSKPLFLCPSDPTALGGPSQPPGTSFARARVSFQAG